MRITETDALIIADVQNDFCPGGALGVKEGEQIIPVLNRLTPRFRHVVLTRDWHPVGHCSFVDEPKFIDRSWPVHCVADSPGAAFHPDFKIPPDALIISKGTDPEKEAYSGFSVPALKQHLDRWGVSRVFVCGLATDYCVKNTALDARKAGYDVCVIEDASRGVDVPPGTAAAAVAEMKQAGIAICRSGDLT